MSGYGKFLMMAAMMGAMGMSADIFPESDSKPDMRQRNDDIKCFRKGCENKRRGNKLYCSSECSKLDKIIKKEESK